jgi:hypothetical protein
LEKVRRKKFCLESGRIFTIIRRRNHRQLIVSDNPNPSHYTPTNTDTAVRVALAFIGLCSIYTGCIDE